VPTKIYTSPNAKVEIVWLMQSTKKLSKFSSVTAAE
jgi:hypothetical protein